MPSPMHRHVIYSAQFFDAVDVVVVAMGTQDRIQLQAVGLQIIQYRRCFARIDHDGMMSMLEQPDVVILQCRDAGDV